MVALTNIKHKPGGLHSLGATPAAGRRASELPTVASERLRCEVNGDPGEKRPHDAVAPAGLNPGATCGSEPRATRKRSSALAARGFIAARSDTTEPLGVWLGRKMQTIRDEPTPPRSEADASGAEEKFLDLSDIGLNKCVRLSGMLSSG